uniref:Movement protein n=1 Tax=Japanese soil-borne wheat mosaic virus TaxID=2030954 RepID=A0A6B9KM70_9VIRU|nr:movement protein [Japanese soil-borne wheat mosaic virus]
MTSKDVSSESYETAYNAMLDAQDAMGLTANDVKNHRQRSFNVVNKYVEKALLQKDAATKMRDVWTRFTKSNKEEGTPYNISYSCVMLNIIPTVPSTYGGTVEVSLMDSGLEWGSHILPDQTQMMELGKGPQLMCFFMHYSIPINDEDRVMKLAFTIDCQMASPKMSVMNVYTYWTQRQGYLSLYSEPQRSTISKLVVGYDDNTKLKTRDDVRRFASRSLVLNNMKQHVPKMLPEQINLLKENVPVNRKESTIDLTKVEREKHEKMEQLRKHKAAATERSKREMQQRENQLQVEQKRREAADRLDEKAKLHNHRVNQQGPEATV